MYQRDFTKPKWTLTYPFRSWYIAYGQTLECAALNVVLQTPPLSLLLAENHKDQLQSPVLWAAHNEAVFTSFHLIFADLFLIVGSFFFSDPTLTCQQTKDPQALWVN